MTAISLLAIAGCVSGPARHDEAPASSTLLDAFFTSILVPSGNTYDSPAQVGPRVRRFHVERDKNVVFVVIYNPLQPITLRGRLIRPTGEQHGTFTVDVPARIGAPKWQSYRRWWAMASLERYPGVWEIEFSINDEPKGRYFFELVEGQRGS